MRYLFLIATLGIMLSIRAQHTIYYNRAEEKVKSLDSAYRYSVEHKDTFRVYMRDGRLALESYPLEINGKRFSFTKTWYDNGNLKYELYAKKHSREYNMKYYWSNGKVKFEESVTKRKLDTTKCRAYTQFGADTVYYQANSFPQFPGGNKAESRFLNNNKIWKSDYRNSYLTVRFIIEKDGSVSGVRIVSGIDKDLDKEAIRIISELPKWKPATFCGDPVRVLIEYTFNTKVKSSDVGKNLGYSVGINNCKFLDY